MKKIALAGFSILISLQLFANPLSANPYPVVRSTNSIIRPANLYPAPGATPTPNPTVSESLLKTFHETFPDAERVVWNESSMYYTVSFYQKNIVTRINYDKNGAFSGSFRYYSESYLPYYLINVVKNKYPGLKIFGVTEITAPSGILYYIKLEGPKYWLTAVLDGQGEGFTQEKYRKSL